VIQKTPTAAAPHFLARPTSLIRPRARARERRKPIETPSSRPAPSLRPARRAVVVVVVEFKFEIRRRAT